MADNTIKILLLVVILAVLGYAYKQNSGTGIIGISGEPAEKAAEEIVHRDCSGTEYIIQKPCSRNGIVLDGLSDETSGAGFETHVLDKNHEGFVRQLGDGVCPPKLVECNVDPPKPCSGNTWLDAMCVRLDVNGNELVLEDGNADACGDGILKQTLDTSATYYKPATQGGLCTFERSGACQKTCPEAQPPACNYTTEGWQMNDLGCVKSRDDLTPVGCGETGEIQLYKAATMNTEYCRDLTKWQSCNMQACPQDCVGSWSDWTPNPDACDVQPSESRIYSITKEAVGNTQYGYGRPCEEIHDKVETRSRQDPIQPCCTQNHDWAPAFSAHGGTCKPNGTGIFAQTTIGNCPDDVKSAYKACCYESGEWENVGECQMNGKQKQVQATNGNCLESVKTREIDCCWKNEWADVGMCNSNGEQPQSRIVSGSCEAVPTEENKDLCDSELARLKTGSVLKDTPETLRSASSIWSGEAIGVGHGRGRLDSEQGWSSQHNVVGQWYEIDNGVVGKITGIAIKGRKDYLQWVKTFKVQYKGTSETWVDVDGGKIYTGNTDKDTQVNAFFDTPVDARYIRIYPQTWNSHMSMRADIFVKSVDPDTIAKLEEVMDVVPADFSEISDFHWRKIIPACELTKVSDESDMNRTLPCHYEGPWGQWGPCDGSKRYKIRTVKNGHLSITGSSPSTQEEQSCGHCKGEWRQEYGHMWAARGRARHHRQLYQKFHITQNAYNGGSCGGVPSNGTTRNHTEHRQKEGDMDWHNHVIETIYGG